MTGDWNEKKIKDLKHALISLRKCQEDLRLARARYNKAVSDLVDVE